MNVPLDQVRPEPEPAAPLARTDLTMPTDRTWQGHPVPEGYVDMIEELRLLLDRVAAAAPSTELVASTTEAFADLNDRLSDHEVGETTQLSGRLTTVPGRAQVAVPAISVDELDDVHAVGRVRFGRHFLGSNGAVHGGAIPLVFDDLLGRLSTVGGRSRSRTAFLHVDYRSVTPIETDLRVAAHFQREEGRKRYIRGTLHDGDRLCAEASSLFVALKPGQP